MSEIDWSKAPEGATHYLPETIEFAWFPCWVKEDGSMYYIMLADGIDTCWEHDDEMDDCIPHLVKRPPRAWSGEGLPPVGVPVEWHSDSQTGWREVVVLAYHEDDAWIQRKGNTSVIVGNPANFRPIRTPEQIAADEREAAIRAIVYDLQDAENLSSLPSIANCLYGKGYRKP